MRSAIVLVLAVGFSPWLQDRQAPPSADDKSKKPALSIRVTPAVSFSPARVRAFAELKGGPDDNQELYCAAVEWDWGDLTQSESASDCEPSSMITSPTVECGANRFSRPSPLPAQNDPASCVRSKYSGLCRAW